jgi:hypothetical protein
MSASPRRHVIQPLYESFEAACKRHKATLAEAIITAYALLRDYESRLSPEELALFRINIQELEEEVVRQDRAGLQ